MNTWADHLFYMVFAGQILLGSYLVPRRMSDYMRRVLARHPVVQYPKLHPSPMEHYRLARWMFVWANHAVLALGLAVLFGVWALDGGNAASDGYLSEAWPAVYGLVQFLPLAALQFLWLSHLKRVRRADIRTIRTAELRPRRVRDHVPSVLLGVAVALFVAVIGSDHYLVWVGSIPSEEALHRTFTLLAVNLILLATALWQLRGRKPDPHQSHADHNRGIAMQLTLGTSLSAVLSGFLLGRIVCRSLDLHGLDALLMSACFQAMAILFLVCMRRAFSMDDRDVEVHADHVTVEQKPG